jgi:hypothetical protein
MSESGSLSGKLKVEKFEQKVISNSARGSSLRSLGALSLVDVNSVRYQQTIKKGNCRDVNIRAILMLYQS